MLNLQRILVVVDPTVEQDPVVNRVRDLLAPGPAAEGPVQVRFLINNANTMNVDAYHFPGVDPAFFATQRRLFVEHHEKMLDALVEEFGHGTVSVSSHFTEVTDLSDGVLTEVSVFDPDVVLKSTHPHPLIRRSLITNTDWRLIRKCPKPLLLVKPRDWVEHGSAVAAVDPLHPKVEQAGLDHQLVQAVKYLGQRFGQVPRVFHCYFPYVSTLLPTALESNEEMLDLRQRHDAALQALVAAHDLPWANVEIVRGDLVPALVSYLEHCDANVLAIGALSRNLLERALVGNTAEKILDECPCDVLVIKP